MAQFVNQPGLLTGAPSARTWIDDDLDAHDGRFTPLSKHVILTLTLCYVKLTGVARWGDMVESTLSDSFDQTAAPVVSTD